MDGWASIELTRAAMLGFRVSPPSSIFFCNIVLLIFILFYSTSGRVGDGCSHEHDRLSEDLGTHLGGEDRVDPTLKAI